MVRVTKDHPSGLSAQNMAVVRVPNRVTEEHVEEYIAPIYRTKGNVRLATYFPSMNMKETGKSKADSVACTAMFGTLELQPEVREVVDSMVERLRTLSRKSDGHFVAVDLRVDILEKKGCLGGDGTKICYGPDEISSFLQKIGFDKDATVYLTQTVWHASLDSLKESFPKTYIKVSNLFISLSLFGILRWEGGKTDEACLVVGKKYEKKMLSKRRVGS